MTLPLFVWYIDFLSNSSNWIKKFSISNFEIFLFSLLLKSVKMENFIFQRLKAQCTQQCNKVDGVHIMMWYDPYWKYRLPEWYKWANNEKNCWIIYHYNERERKRFANAQFHLDLLQMAKSKNVQEKVSTKENYYVESLSVVGKSNSDAERENDKKNKRKGFSIS